MIRIDVEGVPDPGLNYAIPSDNPFVLTGGVPGEIWAFGLRNPWRWSFDRKTGDMYIADVGQGSREEVNFAPASNTGGKNYQWRREEGFTTFSASTPLSTHGVSTPPIFDYGRSSSTGGTSITGGYVYRGSKFPRMQGIYFVGDFNSRNIWGLQRDSQGVWLNRQFPQTNIRFSCFGEDEEGNLYAASLHNGQIFEITDTQDSGYLQITGSSLDSLSGNVQMTFGTEIGAEYQMQSSSDLTTWQNLGASQTATGFTTTLTGTLIPVPTKVFVRVVEVN